MIANGLFGKREGGIGRQLESADRGLQALRGSCFYGLDVGQLERNCFARRTLTVARLENEERAFSEIAAFWIATIQGKAARRKFGALTNSLTVRLHFGCDSNTFVEEPTH